MWTRTRSREASCRCARKLGPRVLLKLKIREECNDFTNTRKYFIHWVGGREGAGGSRRSGPANIVKCVRYSCLRVRLHRRSYVLVQTGEPALERRPSALRIH